MKNLNLRFWTVAFVVLLAGTFRIFSANLGAWNFSPIGAIALFGGAYFVKRWQVLLLPFLSLWASDLILNNIIHKSFFTEFTFFYEGFYWQYGSFVALALFSAWFLNTEKTASRVLGASLLGSVAFFLVTNFGAWLGNPTLYTQDLAGLMTSYAAGLPFFQNTLISDLACTAVLFGGYAYAQRQVPALA